MVGVVVGVPAGIALGRWLWTLFADGISAVPHPTVPALSIALVALGAVVFANLVALFPGRVAARTRTSLLLRAEWAEGGVRGWGGAGTARREPESRHEALRRRNLALKVCCG